MALIYGVKQPLRIYENKLHRNKYVPGGNNSAFFLLCPTNMLLPFQIKRDSGLYPLSSIKLMDDETEQEVQDLITYIESGELEIFSFSEYDYIVHYGQLPHLAIIAPGKYYLELTDNVKTWWSETIYFQNFDPDDLGTCVPTKLTFWDTCDIGDIFYRTLEFGSKQYVSVLYLDIDIGRPQYVNREEGDEDSFGDVKLEYIVAKKQYLLQGVFPQFITDVLNLISPHLLTGVVQITTSRGYTERVTQISFDPKWQGTDGALALTDLIITTDQVIKTVCCDNLEIPSIACLKEAYEVVSLQVEGTDNYDNFEYTDAVTSDQVELEHGDRVLVKAIGGVVSYKSYKGTGLGSPAYISTGVFSNGDGVVDLNRYNAGTGTIYYYFDSLSGRFYYVPTITSILDPVIISGNDKVIKGKAWKNCLIEIWENIGGTHVKVGIGTGAQFISPSGIQYAHDPDAAITYIKCIGLNCTLGQSPNKYWHEEGPTDTPGGIGIMEIGSTNIVGGGTLPEDIPMEESES